MFGIYHRVTKKRRKGLTLCSAVAFYVDQRGPVDMRYAPDHCMSCGQPLLMIHLDFGEVNVGGVPRPQHCLERRPRYFGPKGAPVTEIER